MQLNRLFTPITINGMTLKNRIVMPAMNSRFADNGYDTDRLNRYYWARAEGGAAMVITGGCGIDDAGSGADMMSLRDDSYIEGYKVLTDGMHARGAKVAVQLFHAGRYSKSAYLRPGAEPFGPSAVFTTYTHETARAMTLDEIHTVIRKWGEAAARAKAAGFDAVEILGSAGYLICQFLSPLTNLRTDEYGGSWENRCRFPLEVIRSVRAAVGPDFPVLIRLAGNDFVPGSNNNEDAVRFAPLAQEAGVDALDITGGWHESPIPQITGDLPRAGYTYLAAAIKEAVTIPVIASNRINDPVVAEEQLALETCDLVNCCRTLMADPDWPNKAQQGRLSEIRHCLGCNQGCLANTFNGKPAGCLVNGYMGREELQDHKPEKAKNLLVIGAGAAGCELAMRAAEFGHTVTLWEKSGKLGGQLLLAGAAPAKSEFLGLVDFYEARLRVLGVNVKFYQEATVENVVAGGFDAVAVCTGSTPNVITLPGNSSLPVYTAASVLAGETMPGKNVVVVGGGSVGCETAQYLARRGSLSPEQLFFLTAHQAETPEKINSLMHSCYRNIAIVEVAKSVGAGFAPGTKWPVVSELKRLHVKMLPLTKILEVTDHSVEVEVTDKKTGEVSRQSLPCDTVVLAVGSRPNNSLYAALEGKVPELYNLGDSSSVSTALKAIYDASELAAKL